MIKCKECGRKLNGYNTKGAATKMNRCGKCYLRWKQEERTKRGET